MLKTFLKVFGNIKYILLSLAIFVVVVFLILWFPNRDLLIQTYFAFGFMKMFEIMFFLLGSVSSNHTIFSSTGLLTTALLFGINVSLFVYYIKRKIADSASQKSGNKTGLSGAVGFLFGLLGVGCASCGSLLLASLLSIFGLGSVLSYLPFGGEEFIFIGIIFLLFSIYELLNKIKNPTVCSV